MIAPWHPLVVHFPIAFAIGAVTALVAARFIRTERWSSRCALFGTWCLIVAAAASLVAIATGIAALIGLHASAAAHHAVNVHVKWAMLTSMSLILIAVWRGAGNAHDARPSWPMTLVLIAAAAAVAVTGYRGALNVYAYGVGVSAPSGVGSQCSGRSGSCKRSVDQPPPTSPISATAVTRRD